MNVEKLKRVFSVTSDPDVIPLLGLSRKNIEILPDGGTPFDSLSRTIFRSVPITGAERFSSG